MSTSALGTNKRETVYHAFFIALLTVFVHLELLPTHLPLLQLLLLVRPTLAARVVLSEMSILDDFGAPLAGLSVLRKTLLSQLPERAEDCLVPGWELASVEGLALAEIRLSHLGRVVNCEVLCDELHYSRLCLLDEALEAVEEGLGTQGTVTQRDHLRHVTEGLADEPLQLFARHRGDG